LRCKLGFYLCNSRGDFLVDLRAHAWGAEKQLIGTFAEEGVCEGESAEDAMTTNKVEGPSEIPKKEEGEYDVAEAMTKRSENWGMLNAGMGLYVQVEVCAEGLEARVSLGFP
jgi:hypothetical protein